MVHERPPPVLIRLEFGPQPQAGAPKEEGGDQPQPRRAIKDIAHAFLAMGRRQRVRQHAKQEGAEAEPDQILPEQHDRRRDRSEEHTSELQSLMRISYAVFCLKKKKTYTTNNNHTILIMQTKKQQ